MKTFLKLRNIFNKLTTKMIETDYVDIIDAIFLIFYLIAMSLITFVMGLFLFYYKVVYFIGSKIYKYSFTFTGLALSEKQEIELFLKNNFRRFKYIVFSDTFYVLEEEQSYFVVRFLNICDFSFFKLNKGCT